MTSTAVPAIASPVDEFGIIGAPGAAGALGARLRITPRSLLLVAGVLLFSASVLAVPTETYEALGQYGYVGLFLVTLLASGGLVVPVPYLVLILKAATFLNPVAVAVVAALAAGLGELTGYLLGLSGRELFGNGRWQERLREWIERRGFVTVAVLAFLPNPAFDAAGIAAGALGYPAWRFVVACTVGKAARFLLLALAGAQLWGIHPPP